MRESDIQNAILIALSEAGCTVWRQNVGTGWTGDVHRLANGDILIKNPRPLRAGLCKGSSDIIGIAPDGRFLANEVKSKTGIATKEQKNFIDRVSERGGIAGIVRSPDDALKLIKI
jgi:hypothetical protein